jgi:hypothetical protein
MPFGGEKNSGPAGSARMASSKILRRSTGPRSSARRANTSSDTLKLKGHSHGKYRRSPDRPVRHRRRHHY